VDDKVQMPDGTPLPVILLGNKSDMEDAEPDREQIALFVCNHGFIDQVDTSAKLNLNIDKAVLTLAEKIMENASVIATQAAARVRNFIVHLSA
jgi:Ras-related protein Rab-32